MGTRKREQQQDLWIATRDVVQTPGNAFYDRLNAILDEHKFDKKVEMLCRKFYKKSPYGRPSMAPGAYFRAMLIGYFEGLDSERGIAWRSADSLSLRKFLGFGLDEDTPDHSTISRTRRLYWLETHKAVFRKTLALPNIFESTSNSNGMNTGFGGSLWEAKFTERARGVPIRPDTRRERVCIFDHSRPN